MADSPVSGFAADTTPVGADIIYLVKSPFAVGDDRKVTFTNVFANAQPLLFPAASATAVDGTKYWIGRDADGTNQLHFNSPNGTTMEWSINDVPQLTLSATILAATGAITCTTLTASAATSLTLGTASSARGAIVYKNATNANTLTIQSGVTSASYTLTLPTAVAGAGQVLTDVAGNGTLSWETPAGSGANTALSNLAAVAINTALLPGADNTIDLGAGATQFRTAYIGTSLNFRNGDITATASADLLTIAGGATLFSGRMRNAQGADVASANDLTLGSDGNTFEITGNTQINAITTTGWGNGDEITLLFSSTPTVKHNTAGGAGTAVILLAGSADFSATAGDTLTLKLSEIGGTQAWREKSRTAI